jgi:L-fuconolactonase
MHDSATNDGLDSEPILLPELEICDPHHHLWDADPRPGMAARPYLVTDFVEEATGSGHSIVSSVFVECGSRYRRGGDVPLRPVGETEFVEEQATLAATQGTSALSAQTCAGIVGFADLTLGDQAAEVLDHHLAASPQRFKGVRNVAAWHASPRIRNAYTNPIESLLLDRTFRRGFSQLEPRGLSFDAYVYHTQIGEVRDLARSFPNTQIVLDHLGTPLGIGDYAGRADDVFKEWQASISLLAQHENVAMKLGGLNMELNGLSSVQQRHAPTSEELALATSRYFLHAIEAFGPDRCMFESNFPVDRIGCSYLVLWNSFKRIAAPFSEDERAMLFHDTAVSIYRIPSQQSLSEL